MKWGTNVPPLSLIVTYNNPGQFKYKISWDEGPDKNNGSTSINIHAYTEEWMSSSNEPQRSTPEINYIKGAYLENWNIVIEILLALKLSFILHGQWYLRNKILPLCHPSDRSKISKLVKLQIKWSVTSASHITFFSSFKDTNMSQIFHRMCLLDYTVLIK